MTQQAEEKAKKTASFGASLGELVRGAVGEYHQPTKEAQEALAKAQKQNEQELEKLRTQVTKSEDAHG